VTKSLCSLIFPWGSHTVPQVVSQDVPNNTSHLSHMVCPQLNSDVYYLKRWAGGSKYVHLAGSAQCSQNLMMGQINKLPPKKEKKL
jgi:hypothetical protein